MFVRAFQAQTLLHFLNHTTISDNGMKPGSFYNTICQICIHMHAIWLKESSNFVPEDNGDCSKEFIPVYSSITDNILIMHLVRIGNLMDESAIWETESVKSHEAKRSAI